MTHLPETRNSLLLQVRDPRDAAAWEQFVAVYRPAVYRLARRRGLQDADAEDLAQRVLMSVSQAIATWEKDEARGTFRAWLLRVARNAIFNTLARRPADTARGGTSVLVRLDEQAAKSDAIDEVIDDEHRRALFRWAADEIRGEFDESSWLAFQLTAIEQHAVEDAAAELGKSPGAIYAARSRIMRRLKQKVHELEAE